MKILFVGCVEGSKKLLTVLLNAGKNVVGVITKEESDFNADFIDLASLAQKHNIPCIYVQNINCHESFDFIRKLTPDICYCFGWSQLLKEELINSFPRGVVGFHPAALPHNRGRHPLIWALALGLEETASTFFMINAGADEGSIVSQRKIRINYKDDARTLYDRVLDVALEQEIEFTEAFESNTIRLNPQNSSDGNSWRKRGKADGQIDWRMSSRAIYNLVRSLTKPYVGAHFVFNGEDYKVWKVQEIPANGLDNIEPGKILAINNDTNSSNDANNTVDIKTYDGAIRLIDFDMPADFIKGGYVL